MERAVPVRKPHTSTADLLTWSEDAAAATRSPADAPSRRSLKPAGGITPVMFGAPISEAEAEDLGKRKLCSGSKMKEITGSGIFSAYTDPGESETDSAVAAEKAALRTYQQTVNGISQISFGADEDVSPKKPATLTEVAKQRELSGTLENDAEARLNKQLSEAKSKELSGHDIFGPPPKVTARPLAARNMELQGNLDFALPQQPRSVHTSVKVSNPAGGRSNISFEEEAEVKAVKRIHNQKFQELTGNDIFKEEGLPGPAEKHLSNAKLKEMSGSDIFADGKAASRDYLGGVRKPPGGESSIALI